MKILVTGGSGFIGSNFINNQIKNTDNEILNFDKLTYASNNDNLSSIESSGKYRFVHGDICDKNTLTKAFNEFLPNIVVHFAAESHVDNSINEPEGFITSNIISKNGKETFVWKALARKATRRGARPPPRAPRPPPPAPCPLSSIPGGGVPPLARARAYGGLPDPSHGITPRLAPSCFRRCACCAPSPATPGCIGQKKGQEREEREGAVSYTHLTLPTILLV